MNLVAGDFNGAAWRQTSGNNPHPTSTLEEACADTDFPMPPGSPPLWGPGAIPGEWDAVSSYLQIHMIYGKYACMQHSQFLEQFWASVKETRAAIMKSGYIWTLPVTGTLTDHEGTTIILYISREGLAPIHPPRKKVSMMTEVTIHFHRYRPHENLCFH